MLEKYFKNQSLWFFPPHARDHLGYCKSNKISEIRKQNKKIISLLVSIFLKSQNKGREQDVFLYYKEDTGGR